MPFYAISLEKCSETVQKFAIHKIFSQWQTDFEQNRICDEKECLAYFLMPENGEVKSLYVAVLVETHPTFNSSVIGTVGISSKEFNLHISNLLVFEKWRHLGIGSKLLQFAEDRCEKLGFSTAQLWCSEELAGFYERAGWLKQDLIEIDKDKWVQIFIKLIDRKSRV